MSDFDDTYEEDAAFGLFDYNSMITNMLLLKDIYNKIDRFENMLDAETETFIQILCNDFQYKFLKLCNEFIEFFDRKVYGEIETHKVIATGR